ncbi:hypothetical protein JW826_04465 [Candidatus Woesearchaeota archaeon]|nr:hypothetical protein [Candidatus Woesearchaeota archaeon]
MSAGLDMLGENNWLSRHASAEGVNFINVLEDFLKLYKDVMKREEYLRLPLSLFSNSNLGVLEVVVKTLKENYALDYCKIAKFLGRDDRTIWTSYKNAVRKYSSEFKLDESGMFVPGVIFSNRSLSPLETLTIYARDVLNMSFHELSITLNRAYSTLWISYKHGKLKLEKNERTS